MQRRSAARLTAARGLAALVSRADMTAPTDTLANFSALFDPGLLDGDAMRFPDGRVVYIRPCYVDLYDQLRTSAEAVMLGTPGVGKSTAILYFLWRLLNDKAITASSTDVENTSDLSRLTWIIYQPQQKDVTRFVFNTLRRTVQSCTVVASLVPPPSADNVRLEVYDGVTPGWTLSSRYRRAWLISSPRKAVWSTWAKHVNADPTYMPVFSLDELQRCRELCFPKLPATTVELLHDRWGGSARYVLERSSASKQVKLVQSVEAGARSADLSRIMHIVLAGDGDNLKHGEAPHALLHLMVMPNKLPHAMFASDYCRDLVVSTWTEQGQDAVRNFIMAAEGESPLGSVRGHLFERIALSALFPDEGQMLPARHLRRLGAGALDMLDEVLPCDPRPTFVFCSIAELQDEWRLRPRTVGRPYALNWPSWDAVTRDSNAHGGVTVTMWQFSVSTPVVHGLKQAGLTLAAALVPEGARVRFVFVSPQSTPSDAAVSIRREDEWEQPSWQRGMQQFKLVLDLGPAAMLAAKKSATAMVTAIDADAAAAVTADMLPVIGVEGMRRKRQRCGAALMLPASQAASQHSMVTRSSMGRHAVGGGL